MSKPFKVLLYTCNDISYLNKGKKNRYRRPNPISEKRNVYVYFKSVRVGN